jgi:hypothetical protein
MALENYIEQAVGLVAARQGDINHSFLGGRKQLARLGQPDFRLLFPKGHPQFLPEQPAQMPRAAIHFRREIGQGQFEKFRGRHLFE